MGLIPIMCLYQLHTFITAILPAFVIKANNWQKYICNYLHHTIMEIVNISKLICL